VGQGREPVEVADIGVEITHVTDEMPSAADIARVRQRVATIGRSGDRGPEPDQPPIA